eukprot:scaffold1645_cov194-Cylindrotheca_fusiformis.AAC.1
MVAKWFERVNRDYIPFVVRLADAVPLWHALPSPRHPQGQGVRQLDAVIPFRYQFERFLWAIHCDRVQRSIGLCTTRAEKLAFSWYLHHGSKLYPHGLCDSQAPATHQAFFGFLFRPNQPGWPDSSRNLLENFDSLARETELPDELHEFRPVSVPTVQDDSFQPARLAFAASPVEEQPPPVPMPVVHTQTAAPSPAPGPEAVVERHQVPLVTPAVGTAVARPGATEPVPRPPDSPAIFSISTTSVQPPPAVPAPNLGHPHLAQQVLPSQHPHSLQQQAPVPTGAGQLPSVVQHAMAPSASQQPPMQSGQATAPLQQPAPPVPPAPPAVAVQQQQQQSSPPWWAPTQGSRVQQGGQSSYQHPHGAAPAQQQYPTPSGFGGQPAPTGPATAQVFSPSTSSLKQFSAPTGPVGLLQSAAPKRNLFGVNSGGPTGLGGVWPGSVSAKGPQYLSMMDAGISSASLRASSPPIFLALCFLLGHHLELPSTTQAHRLSDGIMVPLESFILLRQPCLVARPVLRAMESKSKDLCAPMLHYLQGRIRSDPVVGRMGVPVQFEFCTNEFVAQAFTLSGWASITHEPSSTLYSGGSVSASHPPFHPLFFQRALGPALPLTKVPATGYSRQAAVVLGSVILFFFQFLDVKVDSTGHIPDTTSFDQSCFGSILSRWAAVPASP